VGTDKIVFLTFFFLQITNRGALYFYEKCHALSYKFATSLERIQPLLLKIKKKNK